MMRNRELVGALTGFALLFAACDRLPSGAAPERNAVPEGDRAAGAPGREFSRSDVVASAVETVCLNTVWPSGKWVTAITRTPACPGYSATYNAYIIASPTPSGMLICAPPVNSLMPPGYIILRYGAVRQCPGYTPSALNGLTVKAPAEVQLVCSNSPIPAGYVYQRFGWTHYCPTSSWPGFSTILIARPTAGVLTTVCSNSPVPAGWVRKSYGSSTSCPATGGVNSMKIKVPVVGESACYPQTLPSGWRFVSTRKSPVCLNYSAAGPNNMGFLGRI